MPQPTVEEMLAHLEKHAHALRQQAHEADQLTRLPDPVVRVLVDGGLFRLWIPQRFGGLELTLPAALQVYEAAARIDGSIGWAVMIGSGGGLFAAHLDAAVAEVIYRPTNAVIAGSGAPDGQAEQVDGGYRVNGRWRYASGAHYATTFTANCVLYRNGTALLGADGKHLIRAMAFTPSQVTALSGWDSTGMRGTGSHDFEVADAFVPEQHSFSVSTDAPREHGPLYRLPFGVLTELPITAVAVGITLHALESFAALAPRKRAADSNGPLSSNPFVQSRYAESYARCGFVRARLHELARQTSTTITSRGPLTPFELAEITASCALGLSELSAAVGELARVAGMSAVAGGNEFARTWRDLQTLAAHTSVSPQHLTLAGGTLLDGQSGSICP